MDPFGDDDDTRQDHPSQSIHNAAYPDSPYQPGQGQQHHQLRLDTTGPPPNHNPSPSLISSSYTPSSHHSHLRDSSASWSTAATPAPHLTSPQDPPPPYDATRQAPRSASTYSPQHEPLLSERSPSHPPDGGFMEPIPLQPIHTRPLSSALPVPHNGFYAPLPSTAPQSYLEQQQQRQQQQPHLPIGSDDVLSPAMATSGKLAPVPDARWRKRRRLQLCLIAVTLLVIFFVALAVGVAWKAFDLGG